MQLYATKMYERRLAFEAKQGTAPGVAHGGFEQVVGGAGQAGGWTPPVAPPSPPPPVPNYPNYPNVPPEYPPQQPHAPNLGGLFSQLLAGLLGGQGTGNPLQRVSPNSSRDSALSFRTTLSCRSRFMTARK